MPENAALAIRSRGPLRGVDSFPHREILMVASQNFYVVALFLGKADEILDYVEKSRFFKNTLHKSIEFDVLCIFVTAVFGFPFHKAVFTGGDGAGLENSEITHDTEGIIEKKRWYFLHIVPKLAVSLGNIRFLTGGRFQFKNDQRQTIDENNNIRALFRTLNHCPLVADMEGIAFRILKIKEKNKGRLLPALIKEIHLDAVLQIIHEDRIFLDKTPPSKFRSLKTASVMAASGNCGLIRCRASRNSGSHNGSA
jgi:hypothetical protein